jgi:hypothetical protein
MAPPDPETPLPFRPGAGTYQIWGYSDPRASEPDKLLKEDSFLVGSALNPRETQIAMPPGYEGKIRFRVIPNESTPYSTHLRIRLLPEKP